MSDCNTTMFQEFLQQKQALNYNPIWFASTLSLSRNLASFQFPHNLDKEQRCDILKLVSSAVQETPELTKCQTVSAKETSPKYKEFLHEYFLFSPENQEYSEGQAFITSSTENLLAGVNFDDHLFLHLIDFSAEPENGWHKLVSFETALQKKLSFAFSNNFGFLTTNPELCGTAFSYKAYLHLPGILYTKNSEPFLDEKSEVLFQSFLQGTTSFPGNVVTISNRNTLRLTEENILSSIRLWASKLSIAETAARKKLLDEQPDALSDILSRSIGLLKHSVLLELEEALNALSWIQLGFDLGKIKSARNSWIPLFWAIRRAHLAIQQEACNQSKEAKYEDIPRIRAEYVKSFANELSLT
ncbi:protein arginine kinase [Chlamydiifrater phoenicopteri]|uniref:protein arginine kinase n=1 Tax=Chlamydiifrater phoenicopteri TaxID=2681469 RepID=UPI001BCAEB80|nr:protein arginine kinase [Chlamydiifrater phoenicopteri]